MTQRSHPLIAKAVTHIIWSVEFFASLVPRLEFLRSDKHDTFATDYRHIFYNVNFVEQLSLYQVAGSIVHEVLHCSMLHNSRRGSRHPLLWNMACDYAINLIIDKIANLELPDGILLDHRFENMTAEQIYDILLQELSDPDSGEFIFILSGDLLPPAADKSQRAIDEQEWKAAVSHAVNAAKKAGKLPGGLENLFQPLLKPKLPWRQILENFLNIPQPSNRSWNRPNKKYLSRHIHLPTTKYDTTGDLVMAVDTSGSMNDSMVQVVLNQVAYVVSIIKPQSCTLIQHDAVITRTDKFDYTDEFPSGIKIHGRGGTDFHPVFKTVGEMDEPPSALILLTDGYGPWPVEAPDYPVLWILVDSPELEEQISYGEVACINSSNEHL